MDEMRAIRLEIYSDSEYGFVAQSRLRCEWSRLLCERAKAAFAEAEANRVRAKRAWRNRPAPWWLIDAFVSLEAHEGHRDAA